MKDIKVYMKDGTVLERVILSYELRDGWLAFRVEEESAGGSLLASIKQQKVLAFPREDIKSFEVTGD